MWNTENGYAHNMGQIEEVNYFFVKGTPMACKAMFRRALTVLAKATAVREEAYSYKTFDNFEPPYLLAYDELHGYAMITMGAMNFDWPERLTANGIEGVEEFIQVNFAESIDLLLHSDKEGKIINRLDDFGLAYLNPYLDNAELFSE